MSNFFDEVKGEIKKVNWPTKQEVINNTLAVFVIIVVFTVVVTVIDMSLVKLVAFL